MFQLVEYNEQKTHLAFWKDWLTSLNKMQLIKILGSVLWLKKFKKTTKLSATNL